MANTQELCSTAEWLRQPVSPSDREQMILEAEQEARRADQKRHSLRRTISFALGLNLALVIADVVFLFGTHAGIPVLLLLCASYAYVSKLVIRHKVWGR